VEYFTVAYPTLEAAEQHAASKLFDMRQLFDEKISASVRFSDPSTLAMGMCGGKKDIKSQDLKSTGLQAW
jgi:hypothetical protein